MDIKKINSLVADRRWKAMLGELPIGTNVIPFPDLTAIKSCKAIAYDLNSDDEGRYYNFNVDKANLTVAITVKESREEK